MLLYKAVFSLDKNSLMIIKRHITPGEVRANHPYANIPD